MILTYHPLLALPLVPLYVCVYIYIYTHYMILTYHPLLALPLVPLYVAPGCTQGRGREESQERGGGGGSSCPRKCCMHIIYVCVCVCVCVFIARCVYTHTHTCLSVSLSLCLSVSVSVSLSLSPCLYLCLSPISSSLSGFASYMQYHILNICASYTDIIYAMLHMM